MKIRKPDLIVAGLTLLFAFLLAAPPVRGAPLTPQQAGDVYAVAYGQCPTMAGRSAGCPVEWLQMRPDIHVVSSDDICALADQPPPCQVRGLFDSGKVYLSTDVDFSTALGASILLHEYIHYFQWLNRSGEIIVTCEQWLALEQEAYAIQALVLGRSGDMVSAYGVRFAARQLRCTE